LTGSLSWGIKRGWDPAEERNAGLDCLSMPWFWSNTTTDKEANPPNHFPTSQQKLETQLQALPIYAPEIVVPTVLLTATLLTLHTFYRGGSG